MASSPFGQFFAANNTALTNEGARKYGYWDGALRDMEDVTRRPLDISTVLGSQSPADWLKSRFPDSNFTFNPTTGMVNYVQDAGGDFFGDTLLPGLAMAGVGYLSGGFGLNQLLGSFGGGAGIAEAAGGNGGGMWDWLDSLDPTNMWEAENLSTVTNGGGGVDYAGIDSWLANEGNFANDVLGSGPRLPNGTPVDLFLADTAKTIGVSPATLAKSLLGAGGFGGLFAPQEGGNRGGVLGSILNDPLGAAFNATPFLLALAQANKQANDLDGVINKINGEGYTKAVLNPYDLQTGLGRTALEQDLSNRGVSGSSFGYQSLNNYDYARDLGRGDLAAKGLMSSAQLEGNLINARNTNSNLLLGAGLNASGRLFSPQPDPFNINMLRALGALG